MKNYYSILVLFTILMSFAFQNEDKSQLPTDVNQNGVIKKIVEENEIENAYPRFSSDGKRILFQSNRSGKWQLYITHDDINSMISITNDKFNNNFPDWSPDDSKVCFVSDRTGNEEIFMMDSYGKNIQQLTNNKARDIHPYWSPDGEMIYFNSTRGNGSLDIYSLNPETKEVQRITDSKDDETCARKSPTANEIVYLKNNASGLDDVFTMDLNTNTETNITNTSTTDGWPCWSHDGKKIIYSAISDGVYALFQYKIANKKIKQLTHPEKPYEDCRANISRDNSKIVFNRQVEGAKNTIGIYILQL